VFFLAAQYVTNTVIYMTSSFYPDYFALMRSPAHCKPLLAMVSAIRRRFGFFWNATDFIGNYN
jgi:hypothetical protein